jgi:hypothetical protein
MHQEQTQFTSAPSTTSVSPLDAGAPDIQMSGVRSDFLHIVRIAALRHNVLPPLLCTEDWLYLIARTYGLELQEAVTLMKQEVENDQLKRLHYTGHDVYR